MLPPFYSFVPKDYPELKVTPASGGEKCASVEYNSQVLSLCALAESGGFWIVAIDRRMGFVTDHYFLPTSDLRPWVRKQAISDLQYLLKPITNRMICW